MVLNYEQRREPCGRYIREDMLLEGVLNVRDIYSGLLIPSVAILILYLADIEGLSFPRASTQATHLPPKQFLQTSGRMPLIQRLSQNPLPNPTP